MFTHVKGCLFLELPSFDTTEYVVPNGWKQQRYNRDGANHHITILLPNESKENSNEFPVDMNFFIVGLKIYSTTQPVAFLVVHYPAGDKFRKSLGLPEKDFHITIGFPNVDNHSVDKSIKCLTKENIKKLSFIENRTIPTKQFELTHYLHILFPDDKMILLEYINALAMIKRFDDALLYAYTLASIDCNSGIYSVFKIKNFLKHIIDNDTKTILWIMLQGNKADSKYQKYILDQLNMHETIPIYGVVNDEYHKVVAPDNFSHVIENIYASAIILPKHGDFLNGMNITRIIDLTHQNDNRPIETINALKKLPLKYINLPIIDRSVPTMDEMNKILNIMHKENEIGKVIVHCIGGVGRTNLVLMCYLIKYHDFTMEHCLEKLTAERRIILSTSQKEFVRRFFLSKF